MREACVISTHGKPPKAENALTLTEPEKEQKQLLCFIVNDN